MSDVCGDPCPLCKNSMFFDVNLELPSNVGVEGATFIVTDDLEVKSQSKFSMMTLPNQLVSTKLGLSRRKVKWSIWAMWYVSLSLLSACA